MSWIHPLSLPFHSDWSRIRAGALRNPLSNVLGGMQRSVLLPLGPYCRSVPCLIIKKRVGSARLFLKLRCTCSHPGEKTTSTYLYMFPSLRPSINCLVFRASPKNPPSSFECYTNTQHKVGNKIREMDTALMHAGYLYEAKHKQTRRSVTVT